MTQLTEQVIRPVELMAGQKVAVLTDVGRLLTRTAEFVEASCPACAANAARPKYEKHGIRYVECSRGLSSNMWIVARKRES